MSSGFSHFDDGGNAVMVDVSDKPETRREAVAEALVRCTAETLSLIREGDVKKGDVLSVARLAGIMGAKQTAALIPLCHTLPLSAVSIDLRLAEAARAVRIRATCRVLPQRYLRVPRSPGCARRRPRPCRRPPSRPPRRGWYTQCWCSTRRNRLSREYCDPKADAALCSNSKKNFWLLQEQNFQVT